MSWIKQVFTDFQTVITAKFLNDLQDQIIADETTMGGLVTGVKGNSEASYRSGNVNITKANVGLGNVDNTSDAQKPVSNATQEMLDSKVDKVTGKGLSTNDYTNAEKQRVADSALQTDLDALDDRVDQIYNGGVLYDTASGSVASFSDGADNMPVKKLVANIEPVQDLHGYDHPWPAGGGKNLLPMTVESAKARNTTGTWNGNTYTYNGVTITLETNDGVSVEKVNISGTASATFEFALTAASFAAGNYILTSGRSIPSGYCVLMGTQVYGGDVAKTLDAETSIWAAIHIDGNVTYNMFFQPMIRLATEADATFVPYSNECPISGWTGAEITAVNGNLLPVNYTGGTSNGITATVASDKKVELSGTSAGNSFFVLNNAVKLPKGNFTLKGHPGGNNSVILAILEYQNGTYTGTVYNDIGSGVTFASKGEAYDYTVRIVAYTAAGNLNKFTISPQIVLEGSDASYAPYTGDQISVTFPSAAGAVYGGTLSLTPDRTGTLAVDWASAKIRDLVLVKSSGTYFYTSIADKADGVTNIFSEIYKTVNTGADAMPNCSIKGSGSKNVFITDTRYSTVSDLINAVGETLVCYELDTPVIYALTASEVSGILSTLYGTNNIWADCGDVTVTAPRDTKLYIEKLTQPTEDDMTADHAISSGTFFMIGNTLYLATSQIAAGGTITPGTNATQLSLADALNQLNT